MPRDWPRPDWPEPRGWRWAAYLGLSAFALIAMVAAGFSALLALLH